MGRNGGWGLDGIWKEGVVNERSGKEDWAGTDLARETGAGRRRERRVGDLRGNGKEEYWKWRKMSNYRNTLIINENMLQEFGWNSREEDLSPLPAVRRVASCGAFSSLPCVRGAGANRASPPCTPFASPAHCVRGAGADHAPFPVLLRQVHVSARDGRRWWGERSARAARPLRLDGTARPAFVRWFAEFPIRISVEYKKIL